MCVWQEFPAEEQFPEYTFNHYIQLSGRGAMGIAHFSVSRCSSNAPFCFWSAADRLPSATSVQSARGNETRSRECHKLSR